LNQPTAKAPSSIFPCPLSPASPRPPLTSTKKKINTISDLDLPPKSAPLLHL
jgi:hypothetical protein